MRVPLYGDALPLDPTSNHIQFPPRRIFSLEAFLRPKEKRKHFTHFDPPGGTRGAFNDLINTTTISSNGHQALRSTVHNPRTPARPQLATQTHMAQLQPPQLRGPLAVSRPSRALGAFNVPSHGAASLSGTAVHL